jgi:23S rRNA (guanosine2251-2'-O)-methyltransferase
MRHGRRNRSGEQRHGTSTPAQGRGSAKRPPTWRESSGTPGSVMLWGRHAVAAALANPERQVDAIFYAGRAETSLQVIFQDLPAERRALLPEPTELSAPDINYMVPPDAVHQGLVAIARQLDNPSLEDLLDQLGETTNTLLVVLDQVTDPHNVGAVLRSAAAFGAAGLIVQTRHVPPADGVLAKSASGALELVPIVEVTNIARALDVLKLNGFWCVGLSGDGTVPISDARLESNVAMVLGAEGPGLRRLPRERCDLIARLPTESSFGTLNISNAAAIAFYEMRRRSPAQERNPSTPGR